MRVGVVGHVEWVEFVRVHALPERGAIVHAMDAWDEPGGGGAVAAVELARLAGSATLFTALGGDELGRRALAGLQALGIRVEAAIRDEPQRRALTFVDDQGERTITVVGRRMGPALADPLPWGELAGYDAVFVTAGDPGAIRAARAAAVLTATPRAIETLAPAGVEIDALVGSGSDRGERYRPGMLTPEPRLVVRTAGARGGSWERPDGSHGGFAAAVLPGPPVDAYGCGDSFAAGLTYGLAVGETLEVSLELAARSGAAALARRGAYG